MYAFIFVLQTLSLSSAFLFGVDPDEAAHNEPPRLDIHCLPCILSLLSMIWNVCIYFCFADVKFVVCFSF